MIKTTESFSIIFFRFFLSGCVCACVRAQVQKCSTNHNICLFELNNRYSIFKSNKDILDSKDKRTTLCV